MSSLRETLGTEPWSDGGGVEGEGPLRAGSEWPAVKGRPGDFVTEALRGGSLSSRKEQSAVPQAGEAG